MRYVTSFKSLPTSLKGLFFVFFVIPFISIFLMGNPLSLFQNGFAGKALLLIATYWLLPLLICYTLLDKHHWFFPSYIFQCIFLTVHTVYAGTAQPAEMQFARFLLIGLMIYVGFLFGNKNFLYPLITKSIRFWRKAVRYQIGRDIYVMTDANPDPIPALLIDCSKTGMRFSVHSDDMTDFLKLMDHGDDIKLVIPANDAKSKDYILPMKIVWTAEQENTSKHFGCQVLNKKLMKSYVATEKLGRPAPLTFPQRTNLNLEQDIQETALVLWLVCIALSFVLPALGG